MAAILTYGLRELPNVRAAWGARAIFPASLVHDRVSWYGDSSDRAELSDWLVAKCPNFGAEIFTSIVREKTGSTHDVVFTIYEDDRGTMQASAQGSGGYLYVSAWLFDHVEKPDSLAGQLRAAIEDAREDRGDWLGALESIADELESDRK